MRSKPCAIVRIDERVLESFASLSQTTASFRQLELPSGKTARDARAALASVSHFLGVEDQQVGAATGELRHVARCRLAFCAAECRLDVGHAVEGENGDEVDSGRPSGRAHGPLADGVFFQARKFLRERNVGLGIMLVESRSILGCLVEHDEFSHLVLPYSVFCIDPLHEHEGILSMMRRYGKSHSTCLMLKDPWLKRRFCGVAEEAVQGRNDLRAFADGTADALDR